MPTRRQFDLVLIVGLLLPPAFGMVKAWAHKHAALSTGETRTAAAAAVFVL